jgi:hypothetical protein
LGIDAEYGALVSWMNVSADDYEDLKLFWLTMLNTMNPNLLKLPEDQHPANVLLAIELQSPALARKALHSSLGDILEQTAYFSAETLSSVDAQCNERSIPTLSSVRIRFWKRVATIMKRGKLRTEHEYHLMRSLADALGEAERHRAWAMIDEFGVTNAPLTVREA